MDDMTSCVKYKGYAIFKRVRIPRENMAMRYATVDASGKYSATSSTQLSRLAYVTMMQVRVFIVVDAARAMAKATTIAVRYSLRRRQGFNADESGEHRVLQYQTQQYRLFPLLAAAYAIRYSGMILHDQLESFQEAIHGDERMLKEMMGKMHAQISALKSYCTRITADGIEECRRCCGGHGYLVVKILLALRMGETMHLTSA